MTLLDRLSPGRSNDPDSGINLDFWQIDIYCRHWRNLDSRHRYPDFGNRDVHFGNSWKQYPGDHDASPELRPDVIRRVIVCGRNLDGLLIFIPDDC